MTFFDSITYGLWSRLHVDVFLQHHTGIHIQNTMHDNYGISMKTSLTLHNFHTTDDQHDEKIRTTRVKREQETRPKVDSRLFLWKWQNHVFVYVKIWFILVRTEKNHNTNRSHTRTASNARTRLTYANSRPQLLRYTSHWLYKTMVHVLQTTWDRENEEKVP